jgi:hypothetical protein
MGHYDEFYEADAYKKRKERNADLDEALFQLRVSRQQLPYFDGDKLVKNQYEILEALLMKAKKI